MEKYNGCPIPDTDGDGINDESDKCPQKFGLAKNNGCPEVDTDGDGVNDDADKCPTVAGVARNNGCPYADTDGDGITDDLDKCPNEAGTTQNNGCPVREIQKKIDTQSSFIYFDMNKATLQQRSLEPLNQVFALIANNEAIKVKIEGHSDNIGDASYNLSLSKQRANTIMNYFKNKGISPSRLSAAGFGQTKPIESNANREGRAKNRRVEITISEQ